jgi:hypothetical protein
LGGSGGSAGGGSAGGFRRGIDELTLKRVADLTGGAYYPASSASELESVFNHLPTYLIAKHETSEVSVIFVALGVLLSVVAIALSFVCHPLP